MKTVICIGSSAKDIFFPTKEAGIINNPGDLTAKKLIAFEYGAKYQIDDRFESPGGCAANSSHGLARLGVQTACYSRIGSDYEGKWIMENLKKENVNTDYIQIDDKYKTDLSFILVNMNDGDRTIFFNRDANEKLEIKNDLECEWVFASALNGDWQGNMDKIVAQIKTKNIKLAVNPGQANLKADRNKVIEFIKNASLLILNRDEAIEIVGENNDDFAYLLERLRNLGPEVVVITDGLNGSCASNGKEILFAPAIKEKAVDLTGAGDAFGSGFLAAYIKSKSLAECLQWGTANGGNSVKFYGGVEGLLHENEMEEKIKNIEVEVL